MTENDRFFKQGNKSAVDLATLTVRTVLLINGACWHRVSMQLQRLATLTVRTVLLINGACWHRVSMQLQRKPIRILALVLFARHDIDTRFRDIGNYERVASVK